MFFEKQPNYGIMIKMEILKKSLKSKIFIFLSLTYLLIVFSDFIFIKKIVNGVNYSYPDIKSFSFPKSINKDIIISFKFKQNDWIENQGYYNLFQTSDYNQGIRLEMAKSSEQWGLVINKDDESFSVAELGLIPEKNKWHTLLINCNRRDLTVSLDSKVIFYKNRQQLSDMKYNIDNILIGAGFNKDRIFNGEIRDFTIKIGKNLNFVELFIFALWQLFLLLSSFLLLRITKASLVDRLINLFKTFSRRIFYDLIWNYIVKISKNIVKFLNAKSLKWLICFIIVIILTELSFSPLILETNYTLILRWEIVFLILFSFYILESKMGISFFPEMIIVSFIFAKIIQVRDLSLMGYMFMFFSHLTIMSILINIIANLKNKLIRNIFIIFSEFIVFVVFLALTFSLIYIHYKSGRNNIFRGKEVAAFFQSNTYEAYQFIMTTFTLKEILFSLAISIFSMILYAYCFYKSLKDKLYLNLKFIVILFSISISILFLMFFKFSSDINNYKQIIAEIKDVKEDFNSISLKRSKIKIPDVSKKGKGELYFIIMGESSNRFHWSAYGYFRDTTPWAKYIREKEKNSIFLNNVYPAFTHTVPSLTKALTSANQYNGKNEFISESLIQVARKAGFKVYWLSNQGQFGFVDNPLTALAKEADEMFFTKSFIGMDLDLMKPLSKVLSKINPDENNLIIIHLLGSHFEYDKRVPKDFNPYFDNSEEEYIGDNSKDKELIKRLYDYDRSILYTDKVLNRFYDEFIRMPQKKKLFIYFSDHGEDVYGNKQHDAVRFTWDMAHIPFFMIYSEDYAKEHINLIKKLKSKVNSIFTLDLFFDTALSLMDIDYSAKDSKYDLTSDSYAINLDNAVTLKVREDTLRKDLYSFTDAKKIKNDPWLIKRDNLDKLKKIYPEKYFGAIGKDAVGGACQALNEGFDTIEINVSAPDLKMGHAPLKRYNLNLDEYLSKIPMDKLKMLWLDMKELKEEDIDIVIKKLNELDKKYNLKSRTIVENTLISPKMKEFVKNGWKASYYVFIKEYPQDINRGFSYEFYDLVVKKNLSLDEERKLKDLAFKIAKEIKSQQSTDLSFHHRTYHFVKKYLEPLLPENIRYNTWAIENIPEIDDPEMIKKIKNIDVLKDLKIRVIFVSPSNNFLISVK